jgi:hypothetical protein
VGRLYGGCYAGRYEGRYAGRYAGCWNYSAICEQLSKLHLPKIDDFNAHDDDPGAAKMRLMIMAARAFQK